MGLPVSTYHLIFDVLVRCQKIMLFRSHPDRPTNRKIGPKHARIHHSRERPGTYAGRGPWGGHARDQKTEKCEKERCQLESLKGKVDKLESCKGSNTPEGQRPGEFIRIYKRLIEPAQFTSQKSE